MIKHVRGRGGAVATTIDSLSFTARSRSAAPAPRSPSTYAGSALGWPLEIVRHAPGTGVEISQAGWEISAGGEESPNVDQANGCCDIGFCDVVTGA